MSHVRWSRDELKKVLSLYCQLPFGKMHSTNAAVIAVAEAIGRTPSAVALKLVNFASLDPELQERGVGGMGNTSAADRSIWAEFYGRWEDLATASEVAALQEDAEALIPSGPTEVLREVHQRRGLAFFRSAVLAAHESTCCITGISSRGLLRASHIVPWAEDEALRLDPRNGLCLNALHDAAFDRGMIAMSDNAELIISPILRDTVPREVYLGMFERYAGLPIRLPHRFRPLADMFSRHRNRVFVA